MSILQEIHFESGLLNVVARGEFLLEEAKRAFLEILGAVTRYQAEKVVLDGRNLKGKPADIASFYYSRFAAEKTMRLVNEYKYPFNGLHMFSMSLFVTHKGLGKLLR